MSALDDAIPVDPTDPADDRVWCPTCEGERNERSALDCSTCRGRGWVREDEWAKLVDTDDEEEEDE